MLPRSTAAAVLLACAMASSSVSASTRPFEVGETVEYCFFWNGIPVGNARAVVRQDPYGDALKLDLSAATNEWIDKLYRFRLHWTSSVNRDRITPTRLIMAETENHRRTRYIVHFDRRKKTITSTKKRLDKDKTRHYAFTNTTAQDALSTAYALRMRDLKPGQTFAVDVLTGKRLYRLTVKVGDKQDITVSAGTFSALCLTAQPKRLNKPEKPGDRPPLLRLWVTADVRHVPLKVSVKTRWGTVWGERTSPGAAPAKKANTPEKK